MIPEPPTTTPTAMTLVYRYGLMPPVMRGDEVREQMRLAHRYQNQLVEIERERRAAVRELLDEQATVAPLAERLADLEGAMQAHRSEILRRRQRDRTRKGTPQERERTDALRAKLREARAALKAAKGGLRADPAVAAAVSAANAAAAERVRDARAACGCYWGTYLLVERAMDSARRSVHDPRFRAWRGEGYVGVQIQSTRPLTTETLIEATDTRLRLDMTPRPIPGRGGKPRPTLYVRIGSDGREPVWAAWPVVLHRPIPTGARITWAQVALRRTASDEQWSLHLTLEIPALGADAGDKRQDDAVALNLGWRREGDDELRAADWHGTDGERGDVMLGAEIRSGLEKADSLESIRDRAFNDALAAVVAWREAHSDALEDEHRERMKMLPAWRSQGRLAGLALWWREHRLPDDGDMLETLEAWRKQDKHLWLWASHQRRKSLARRREQYRVLAARLAERYSTLVVERLDLRMAQQIPPPESGRESNPQSRSQRTEVAPSELRQACINAFRRRGLTVATVPAGGPASELLATWRERSGAVEITATARTSRFSELRRKRRAERAVSPADAEPLADDDATR